jgi:hypothetical protein
MQGQPLETCMHDHAFHRTWLRRGVIPAAVTLAVLAIPLLAMQFSPEVAWDVQDFLIMGALVFGTGLALEWALRSGRSAMYRGAMGLALLTALVMTWANLAVGLLGGESSLVNAWLLGVVAAGVAGAVLARLRAAGMALTLLFVALAHGMLTWIAMAREWKPVQPGPIGLWAPNALFILFFLAAAVLFWVVAGDERGSAGAGQSGVRGTRLLQAAALCIIGAALGALGITVGQADDAPGAGAGGLLLLAGAGVLAWRIARRLSGRFPE